MLTGRDFADAGVQPEGCADAALFDGDYILDLVDRDAAACRWEVQFDPHCRLYRATLTARPRLRELELSAALEGAVPGPRWSGSSPAALGQPVSLRLDTPTTAGCRWPEAVTVKPIAVGQGFQPDAAPRARRWAMPTLMKIDNRVAKRVMIALFAGIGVFLVSNSRFVRATGEMMLEYFKHIVHLWER